MSAYKDKHAAVLAGSRGGRFIATRGKGGVVKSGRGHPNTLPRSRRLQPYDGHLPFPRRIHLAPAARFRARAPPARTNHKAGMYPVFNLSLTCKLTAPLQLGKGKRQARPDRQRPRIQLGGPYGGAAFKQRVRSPQISPGYSAHYEQQVPGQAEFSSRAPGARRGSNTKTHLPRPLPVPRLALNHSQSSLRAAAATTNRHARCACCNICRTTSRRPRSTQATR